MTGNELAAAVGAISHVASALIEKISEALTGLAKPWQIRRVASAEADAKIILAKGDVEADAIVHRAFDRLVREECVHQVNMEAVIKAAVPLLLDTADPAKMDNDWISHFFANCRTVSDEEMQSLWASILAGEANAPGSFSKRTVSVLAGLDKNEAKQFERVCSVAVSVFSAIDDPNSFRMSHPIVLEPMEFYESLDLYSPTFSELDTAGLLAYTSIGFSLRGNHDSVFVEHDGQTLRVARKLANERPLMFGRVSFSKAGRELAPICRVVPAKGLLKHLEQSWSADGFHISPAAK